MTSYTAAQNTRISGEGKSNVAVLWPFCRASFYSVVFYSFVFYGVVFVLLQSGLPQRVHPQSGLLQSKSFYSVWCAVVSSTEQAAAAAAAAAAGAWVPVTRGAAQ